MSYSEYFDLFYTAQKKSCKYRALLIDVKNSRNVLKSFDEYHKFHLCIDHIIETLSQLGTKRGNEILLQNENNVIHKTTSKTRINDSNLNCNPMILGDCACFFINDGSLSENDFISILCNAINKFKIDFAFHFASGKYETDSYAEGNKKLYKGYMLPLLENISKTNGIIIDKNYRDTKQK